MKDASTNTTTVRMTVSYLSSTDRGVHKHHTTSIVVEIGLQDIPGTERRLYNLHRTSMTIKTALSHLPTTETGVYKHQRTSTDVEIELLDIPGCERRLYNLHDSDNGII